MKTLLLVIAVILAITGIAKVQDAKASLRDFTPKYSIDSFSITGEYRHLKRSVIQLQNAAGIRSAYWDDASFILTVQYNNRLIQSQAIRQFFLNNRPLTVQEVHKPGLKTAFLCCLVKRSSITSKK